MTLSPTPHELLATSRQTLFAILNVHVCPICAAPLRDLQVRAIELDRERVRLGKLLHQQAQERETLVAFCEQMKALIKETNAFCEECKGKWNLLLLQADSFEAFVMQPPASLHHS